MADAAGDGSGRPKAIPLYAGSTTFLTDRTLRRILTLAGYRVNLGWPREPDAMVAAWGRSHTAKRAEKMAQRSGAGLLRIEDAFLRSVHPAREGREPPLGLLIDPHGVHFDSSCPSLIEHIIRTNAMDDTAILDRAREGIARLKALHLSKYNAHDPRIPAPDPGYVLVIDQVRDDASIRHGGATASTFREMLVFAQEENPGARIIIKPHPETIAGRRMGHYNMGHARGRISLLTDPVSPWELLDGAIAVYTVSSHMGFEAILAGHKPRVFGQPFYAGWGLTQDENPVARREKRLTRAQLFAAAMILAPTWYDPCRDRLCSFEEAVDQLEASVRAWREDHGGHVALGMRLWKRPHLQRFFGRHRPLRFESDPGRAVSCARREGRGVMVWASREPESLAALARGQTVTRVEDGFIRSRGLGAELVPPMSLVVDRWGIYYDPLHMSELERLIAKGPPPGGEARAERLIGRLIRFGLSKYCPEGGALPDLPHGRRILVPGQVEDDASIRLGAGDVRRNIDLLARVRAENPDAVILYKPHPDVEAGLRIGHVTDEDALRHADVILRDVGPSAAIEAADEIWTMTSTLGFEALLRGKRVTCLGAPFYAGWGLTRDLFPAPARRKARPSLAALAHAVLIAYPRYLDPVSGLPCPPEVVVDRLIRRQIPASGAANRALSRLQGLLASQAWIWR